MINTPRTQKHCSPPLNASFVLLRFFSFLSTLYLNPDFCAPTPWRSSSAAAKMTHPNENNVLCMWLTFLLIMAGQKRSELKQLKVSGTSCENPQQAQPSVQRLRTDYKLFVYRFVSCFVLAVFRHLSPIPQRCASARVLHASRWLVEACCCRGRRCCCCSSLKRPQ